MKTKLSDRAITILQHIADCSKDGESWLPALDTKYGHDYSHRSESHLNIAGSGDARILNSLRDKGLIFRRRDDCCGDYAWLAVTDSGLLALERERDRIDGIFHSLRKERILRDRLMSQDYEAEATT